MWPSRGHRVAISRGRDGARGSRYGAANDGGANEQADQPLERLCADGDLDSHCSDLCRAGGLGDLGGRKLVVWLGCLKVSDDARPALTAAPSLWQNTALNKGKSP